MMRDNFLTVDAHAVNHGDVLAGVNGATGRPVGSILCTAFQWVFGDEDGREIDRRPLGARVQVVRQSPGGAADLHPDDSGRVETRLQHVSPAARSLQVLRDGRGLWLVGPP